MKFSKSNQTKRKPNKRINITKMWKAFDSEEIDITKKNLNEFEIYQDAVPWQ